MILKALQEGDWHIHHRAAVRLLETATINLLPALLDALKNPVACVRERAVYVLGELGDTAAVESLISMAQDEDAHVRYHVLYALERLRAQDALPIFLAALQTDADADVRYRAAAGLGIFGDAAAVPALLDALHDDKLHVRHSAIHALGLIGDERAIDAVRACCTDSSLRIRQAAAQALTLLGEEHPAHILHINRDSIDL